MSLDEYAEMRRAERRRYEASRKAKDPAKYLRVRRESNARWREENPEAAKKLQAASFKRWRLAHRDEYNAAQRSKQKERWRKRQELVKKNGLKTIAKIRARQAEVDET